MKRPIIANAAANFAGQSWSAVLNLASVPFFLALLGAEGYGLVGFFLSLQFVLSVLDLGLSLTANREFARRSDPSLQRDAAQLLRTLELVYVAVAVGIGLALALLADALATGWFHSSTIDAQSLTTAIMLMGAAIAVRWPASLYLGVLRGMERQLLQNVISASAATLRIAGAVLVLHIAGPSVVLFFKWQALVAAAEVVALGTAAWYLQPPGSWRVARFQMPLLRGIWRFSAQVSLVSLLAAILKQYDKILLAKYVPLEMLGYYTAAATLSAGLLLFVTPISGALFPRLSALHGAGDLTALLRLYRQGSRAVAALLAPAACAMIFFAEPLLGAWTRSPAAASYAAPVLAILGTAMLLNACMQLPWALQVAAGKPVIALVTNAIGVAVLVPVGIQLIRAWGILGAGVGWLAFNIGYFGVVSLVIERHVFGRDLVRWPLLWRDTLPLLLSAIVCFGGSAAVLHASGNVDYWPLAITAATLTYAALSLRLGGRSTITLMARHSSVRV